MGANVSRGTFGARITDAYLEEYCPNFRKWLPPLFTAMDLTLPASKILANSSQGINMLNDINNDLKQIWKASVINEILDTVTGIMSGYLSAVSIDIQSIIVEAIRIHIARRKRACNLLSITLPADGGSDMGAMRMYKHYTFHKLEIDCLMVKAMTNFIPYVEECSSYPTILGFTSSSLRIRKATDVLPFFF